MIWNWAYDGVVMEMDQWHDLDTLAQWIDTSWWLGGMYVPRTEVLAVQVYPDVQDIIALWLELKPVIRHRIDEFLGELL